MSMTRLNPPTGGAGNSGAQPDKVTSDRAMTYLAFTLIFLVVAPPVGVILWRLATMPWG